MLTKKTSSLLKRAETLLTQAVEDFKWGDRSAGFTKVLQAKTIAGGVTGKYRRAAEDILNSANIIEARAVATSAVLPRLKRWDETAKLIRKALSVKS